jgi:hypothetical protein
LLASDLLHQRTMRGGSGVIALPVRLYSRSAGSRGPTPAISKSRIGTRIPPATASRVTSGRIHRQPSLLRSKRVNVERVFPLEEATDDEA